MKLQAKVKLHYKRNEKRGLGFDDDSKSGKAFLKYLKDETDYLLDTGPGKSSRSKEFRSTPPDKEILLSSDYIERTMHPALGT